VDDGLSNADVRPPGQGRAATQHFSKLSAQGRVIAPLERHCDPALLQILCPGAAKISYAGAGHSGVERRPE
jgi:hypothetical protein